MLGAEGEVEAAEIGFELVHPPGAMNVEVISLVAGVNEVAIEYERAKADPGFAEPWSISAGLDYPSVGPEHARRLGAEDNVATSQRPSHGRWPSA